MGQQDVARNGPAGSVGHAMARRLRRTRADWTPLGVARGECPAVTCDEQGVVLSQADYAFRTHELPVMAPDDPRAKERVVNTPIHVEGASSRTRRRVNRHAQGARA